MNGDCGRLGESPYGFDMICVLNFAVSAADRIALSPSGCAMGKDRARFAGGQRRKHAGVWLANQFACAAESVLNNDIATDFSIARGVARATVLGSEQSLQTEYARTFHKIF